METRYRDLEIAIQLLVENVLRTEIEERKLPYGKALADSAAVRIAANAVNQALRELHRITEGYHQRITDKTYALMDEGERLAIYTKVEEALIKYIKEGNGYGLCNVRVSHDLKISKSLVLRIERLSDKVSAAKREQNIVKPDGRRSML